MDHAVQQRVPVSVAQHRVFELNRRRDPGLVVRLEIRDGLGIDVRATDDRVVRDIPLQGILRGRGTGETQRTKVAQFVPHSLDRGIVAFHVADHQAHPGLLAGRDDRLAFRLRKRDRFLDEDVPSGLRRGNCHRLVAAGRQHEHRVQRDLEQRRPIGETPLDGYDGIDLGPIGYLGTRDNLGEHLRSRGLYLSGGYMPLPLSDPAGMEPAMAELTTLLDLFESAKSPDHIPPPKPTLADAGSGARRLAPGRANSDRSLGLQPEGWDRLAVNLQEAVELCRARGYEPTFHHHAGTYVEAPWEIEELLARSDVGLCLDTGHLVLGGGDPVSAIRDWGSRINHVHLKDVRRSVIDAVIREGGDMMQVWRRGAFCRLGIGDLDIDAILKGLRAGDYRGWLVVEQDVIPGPETPPDAAALDQDRNRAYLRARGL